MDAWTMNGCTWRKRWKVGVKRDGWSEAYKEEGNQSEMDG
jgi:hypothetical protein